MDSYVKGETREEPETDQPFSEDLLKDVPVMKIKPGTKVRNIAAFVQNRFSQNAKVPAGKILFTGIGPACTKTISCVEVVKREQLKKLQVPIYQCTRIRFKRIEEFWEPQVAGLERLKVNRDIPRIAILLSKDELDLEDAYDCSKRNPFAWLGGSFPSKKRPQKNKKQTSSQKLSANDSTQQLNAAAGDFCASPMDTETGKTVENIWVRTKATKT